jgi:hypothetical protein
MGTKKTGRLLKSKLKNTDYLKGMVLSSSETKRLDLGYSSLIDFNEEILFIPTTY